MIGEVSRLPKETLEDALEKAEALTHSNTGLILNFALNYGGRAELLKQSNKSSGSSRCAT